MSGVRACLASAAWVAFAAGCAERDDGITYAEDIQPLFEERGCTLCHRPGAPAGPTPGIAIDILNPNSPELGLMNSRNLWKDGHPEIASPDYIVAQGQPDDSFLVHKIEDPALGLLAAGDAGGSMPPQFEPLTEGEKASIESWVLAGAEDTESFRSEVVPIFGTDGFAAGKCIYCHYEGTPTPPDLTHPFGPDGVVNVEALFRTDMLRVKPGDPEQSLLVAKIRAEQPSSEFGAPMPHSFLPFNAQQVQRVRRWIGEGARP